MSSIVKKTQFYECSQCNHLLVDPVTIPCGYSVCKHHLDELLDFTKCGDKFHCDVCHKKHRVPEEGFIINKHIQNALDIRFSALNLNPVHEESNKEIDEARKNLENIETLERNSENYIYAYFEEIKRQVDLRREELKMKIDDYSDQIIKDVENEKSNCIRLFQKVNRSSLQTDKSKLAHLTEFIERLNTFGIQHKTFGDIMQSIAILNKKFTRIIDEFNDSLIGNKKYSFDFKDLPFEDIFGCFKITENDKFDSVILKGNLQGQLLNLCEIPNDQKLNLQYRATRDGFAAEDFHRKCDGISNTLTVIKATSGNVFGGFTEKYWRSNGKFITDPNAFIFSLVNKENNPFKVMCSNNGFNAIGCDSNAGPIFGGDSVGATDIIIESNSNAADVSYSLFGNSYKHPEYQLRTSKAESILAGSLWFQTVDIEVFAT